MCRFSTSICDLAIIGSVSARLTVSQSAVDFDVWNWTFTLHTGESWPMEVCLQESPLRLINNVLLSLGSTAIMKGLVFLLSLNINGKTPLCGLDAGMQGTQRQRFGS
jgi:hypothetical protein